MTAAAKDLGDVLLDALVEAYDLAYSDRRATLRGTRLRSFDDRGLNRYSECWGRIQTLEALLDVTLPVSPSELRAAAEDDALAAFTEDVRNG